MKKEIKKIYEEIDAPQLHHVSRGIMFIQKAWDEWRDSCGFDENHIRLIRLEVLELLKKDLEQKLKL